LLLKPKSFVERFYLCDLKGVGLQKFKRDPRVKVARTVADVARIIRRVVAVDLKERIDFMAEHEIERHPGARIIVAIDEFAVLQQHRVAKGSAEEKQKAQLLADLHLLSQQAAAAGIILISSVQKASAIEMDGDYKGNLEDIWLFRVHHRSTSVATLGPTEDLPADPTRQLSRGECIYRHPAARADRVLRIFMCAAAKDDLAKMEAAKVKWAARPDIDIDDDNDNVVPLHAAE
jgi:hypothetical protein